MGSAKERAYKHLKTLIVNRTVAEGDFMTEAEVAETLGVSRTPVREAFLRLEAENLVRLVPKKGALVPPVTARGAREVTEVRRIVEVFAAERAIERGSELAGDLEELLARQRELADQDHVTEFLACDQEFHESIVRASGNELLAQLYRHLRDQQMRMGMAAMLTEQHRHESVLEEHEAIVDAFRNRDPAACAKAIEAHLSATLRCLLEVGGATPPGGSAA